MHRAMAIVGLLVTVAGCATAPPSAALLHPNPIFLPATDREFVWQQVVDVVDDYFKIEREERVHLLGDLETEGRIDTYPIIGATVLEPWRGDSASVYDRLESTLQTVRRRALVRVVPESGGYLIDLAVFKEVEDMRRSDHSTASASVFRNDSSLQRFSEPVGSQPVSHGWIPLGRDVMLEQRMLGQIQARLGHPVLPATPGGFFQPVF